MQNVVDVACSSPPVVMNATKPAAQAVQAADQDPFGLVLQKASERIVNDKQSDRSSKSSDLKSTENTSGSDSTARKKNAESKSESEVNQTTKTEKVDQPEKTSKLEKTEKSEDDEKSTNKESANDPSNMVFGYVNSEITVVNNQEKGEAASADSGDVIAAEAVKTPNLPQMAANTNAITEESVSTPPVITNQAASVNSADQTIETADKAAIAAEQTIAAASTGAVTTETTSTVAATTADTVTGTSTTGAGPNENPETKVETTPTSAFSETSKSGDKLGESTKIESKPVTSETTDKMVDGGNTSLPTNANSKGQTANSVVEKYQEAAPSIAATAVKNEKPVADNTNPETAPPDIPDGTASVPVQTTSQISEPARLAEAPKNEVINQVAIQVDQMVKTNRSSLRMQLYPEELGHIDLRIVTTKDGISVTMVTEKASTQQVLKSDMDVLKQNIEQAGIQLSNLNINQGQNSNKQQSFEHRQNFSNSSYPGSSSENSNSSSHEPKKHLVSSVVDYKV